MKLVERRSPNHDARPAGVRIRRLILHCDASASEYGALDWVTAAKSEVSYHYLIGRKGTIYAIVDPRRRAWGARGHNTDAIHVAFANRNDGKEPLTAEQWAASLDLAADLFARFPLELERVTLHRLVDPERKSDIPAAIFDLTKWRVELAPRLRSA